MISFSRRYEAFVKLGKYLLDLCLNPSASENSEIHSLAERLLIHNPWFIEVFVLKALELWATRLSPSSIEKFVSKYPDLKGIRTEKHASVIFEDKVPFAGLSDLMAVLLSGYHFYGKNQNNQHDDLQFITDKLIAIEPAFTELIHWDCPSKEVDTFLVHSKSSSDRTFISYFEERHSLIRQKAFSISIITDNDGVEDYKRLGDDIFTFFGLSPYNVRKLFVPRNFSVESFLDSLEQFAYIYQYNRYANNYDYHRSVFMMEQIPFFDNGFMVFRESSEVQVPLGCLYYEYYDSLDDIRNKVAAIAPVIQQVVTNLPDFPGAVKPGEAHAYQLWEFEDHKDTLKFLIE